MTADDTRAAYIEGLLQPLSALSRGARAEPQDPALPTATHPQR